MIVKIGQAGIEYVILIGLLLAFLIPIIHYAWTESNTNVKFSQLDNAARRIAAAADAVFSVGPGTSQVVVITLPKGVNETKVENNEVLIRASTGIGISDFHASTKASIVGNIPKSEGTHHIIIQALDDGTVRVGKGPFISALMPNYVCANDNGDHNGETLSFDIVGENFKLESCASEGATAGGVFCDVTQYVDETKLIVSINYDDFTNPCKCLSPGEATVSVVNRDDGQRSNAKILHIYADGTNGC